MKHLLIIALLLSTGCTNTQKINRHLRLSKKHLFLAQALGAKFDSIKTEVKGTGNVGTVHESDSTTAKVDDNGAVDACADLLSSIAGENNKLQRSLDSLKNIPHPKPSAKPIRDTQKAVCPNDSVHKVGSINITVGKESIKIPFILDAWSKGGKAGYNLQLPKTEFEYTVQNVQVTAAPGHQPTFFGKLLRGAGLILIGIVIGFILSKVLKFGVNL